MYKHYFVQQIEHKNLVEQNKLIHHPMILYYVFRAIAFNEKF